MLMRFNKLGLKPLMNVRALSSAEPAIKDKPKRAPNGHKRPCLVEHQARNAALEAAAAEKKLDWRLMGATYVILLRLLCFGLIFVSAFFNVTLLFYLNLSSGRRICMKCKTRITLGEERYCVS